MKKNKYKLKISYDGTNYFGWQIQPKKPTVQKTLENAFTTLLKTPIKIYGSGRTDAGVHAFEQVAHFSSCTIDPIPIKKSLNGILPKDIRILSIEKTSPSFHARYSSFYKTYIYLLSRKPSIFLKNYIYYFPYQIDFELLQKAVQYFIKKDDFSAFANAKCSNKQKIKTIHDLSIAKHNDILLFEITSDGFLYKMARNIIGTLVDVATKKIALEQIPKIFLSKKRTLAGRCVPSCGLFLKKVHYVKSISFKEEKWKTPLGMFNI